MKKKEKKLVIFEIDNVLADRDRVLSQLLGETEGDLDKLIQDPNIYYGMKQIKPMVGLLEDLNASGYPIAILSQRPSHATNFTKKWVKSCDFGVDFVFIENAKDKVDFLRDIRDSIEFIIESDIEQVKKLEDEKYTVFSYTEKVVFADKEDDYRHPCLYVRSDGIVMLWERVDEEAIPLMEWLNNK